MGLTGLYGVVLGFNWILFCSTKFLLGFSGLEKGLIESEENLTGFTFALVAMVGFTLVFYGFLEFSRVFFFYVWVDFLQLHQVFSDLFFFYRVYLVSRQGNGR